MAQEKSRVAKEEVYGAGGVIWKTSALRPFADQAPPVPRTFWEAYKLTKFKVNERSLSQYLGSINKDDMKLLDEGLHVYDVVPKPAPGYVELTDCFEFGLVGSFLAGGWIIIDQHSKRLVRCIRMKTGIDTATLY